MAAAHLEWEEPYFGAEFPPPRPGGAPGFRLQEDSLPSFHMDGWERVKRGRGLSPSTRPDPLGRKVNLEHPILAIWGRDTGWQWWLNLCPHKG